MTPEEIVSELRKEAQELKKRGEYLVTLANELEHANDNRAISSGKSYDQRLINEAIKAALERGDKRT